MNCSEFTPSFFDASSEAWKINKIPDGAGSYIYIKNAFLKDDMPKPPRKIKTLKNTYHEKEPPVVRRSKRIRDLRHTKVTGIVEVLTRH